MSLQLKLITPTATVMDEEVDQITLPTANGEITILPGHVNLVTKVVAGEMITKKGNRSQGFAVFGGFLEVSKDKVSILADYAVRAEDIEVGRAKEAQERAQKAMKDKATGQDFRIANAELRKALLELKVATKHKRIVSK
ncbi:MAG: ATP synthase F1 subunit epsilon [Candidatus Levybacteria bacterium]|nr:ATP synthase F1 subunit epsilon [Candidatus Levybacteria bacterium]